MQKPVAALTYQLPHERKKCFSFARYHKDHYRSALDIDLLCSRCKKIFDIAPYSFIMLRGCARCKYFCQRTPFNLNRKSVEAFSACRAHYDVLPFNAHKIILIKLSRHYNPFCALLQIPHIHRICEMIHNGFFTARHICH